MVTWNGFWYEKKIDFDTWNVIKFKLMTKDGIAFVSLEVNRGSSFTDY